MATDFGNLASTQDPFITAVWSRKCSELEASLSKSDEALTALMEPGTGWKTDLREEDEMEAIIAQSENTIMRVKGKKLTTERDSLVQAHSFKNHVQENIRSHWLSAIGYRISDIVYWILKV